MEEASYKSIIYYLKKTNAPASPKELADALGKSRVTIHASLKKLLANGLITKEGVSPRVSYGLAKKPSDVIEEIKAKATPVLARYPIVYAGVFGSVARGQAKEGSDIDIMIDYRRPFSLISMVGLERALTEALGKKVDLVTEPGASNYMKSHMLGELKVFYGSR